MAMINILKFNGDGTLDWTHDDGNGQLTISALSYGKLIDGSDDKTIIILECSVCNTKAFYPMSGGPLAQQLHREYLRTKSLAVVQGDATDRSIETTGKTQDELIELIIQDECMKMNVSYIPEEA